jgi:hypothetical protein
MPLIGMPRGGGAIPGRADGAARRRDRRGGAPPVYKTVAIMRVKRVMLFEEFRRKPMSAALLQQINALLPERERIPSVYISTHFGNCSDELLKCVIHDRLEARLRKLDTIVAGTRVRRLEGCVWAEPVLAAFPQFQTPKQ